MKFLKWGAIGLGAILVIALAVGFFLPAKVHVERSIVIARPQATVYTVVSDWRQFNEWSPWFELDPDAQFTYEGAPGEIGARMAWKGKGKAGAGSQEIIETEPFEKITSKLVFGEKAEDGEALSTMTVLEVDGGTEVVWSFDYEAGMWPWERYMALMMDGFVGGDYEKGLENLKAYVEKMPEADFANLDVEFMDVEPVPIAYMTVHTASDAEAIGTGYQKGYEAVWSFMKENSITSAGMPMGINISATEEETVFDAAMPIPANVEPPAEGLVKIGTTYGGKSLRVVHRGPYGTLDQTYEKIAAYMAAHRLEPNGRSWEHFVTDPGEVAEADLVTHVYMPVK